MDTPDRVEGEFDDVFRKRGLLNGLGVARLGKQLYAGDVEIRLDNPSMRAKELRRSRYETSR